MKHWLLEKLNETRRQALKEAERAQIFRELLNAPSEVNNELVQRSADMLEMAVLDLAVEDIADDEEKLKELKLAAADAFRLLRALPRPTDALASGMFVLRAGTLAVLGDKGFDAARWMREENTWPDLPVDSHDWRERTWATVIDICCALFARMGGLIAMLYWIVFPGCVMPNLILREIILKDRKPPMRRPPHWS